MRIAEDETYPVGPGHNDPGSATSYAARGMSSTAYPRSVNPLTRRSFCFFGGVALEMVTAEVLIHRAILEDAQVQPRTDG
jgi:hypothetical protein